MARPGEGIKRYAKPRRRLRAAESVLAPDGPVIVPPGRFELKASDDAKIRQICGAEAAIDGEAHPIFGFIAAIGGLGMPIGELFTRLSGAVEAGPLLASCVLYFSRPMKVGITYQVEGEVESLTR